jgi:NAD(P)-dependent dehydrogenase (short-subunit alcohol dehydrogenase family)
MPAANALTGRIALVTGSSKGIGAAIAQRLARDGATVIVNYAGAAAPAEDVVARIKAAGGIVIAEPYGYEGEERVEPSEQVSADIATFADPDGNYFQLMSPMDPSQM